MRFASRVRGRRIASRLMALGGALQSDVRLFLERLDTRSPSINETDALACPASAARRLHLLHAAAERFAPRACHALWAYWRERARHGPAAEDAMVISRFWGGVCEWLPLAEAGRPSSRYVTPHQKFRDAWRLEHLERRADAAIPLYLSAAKEGHALGAARATQLLGAERRLEGWLYWQIETPDMSAAITAMRCFAVACHLLDADLTTDGTATMWCLIGGVC